MSTTLPALLLASVVETDGLSRPLLLVFIVAVLIPAKPAAFELAATSELTDGELALIAAEAATGLDACIIASARSLPTIASTC